MRAAARPDVCIDARTGPGDAALPVSASRRLRRGVVVTLACVLLLAACGGSGTADDAAGSITETTGGSATAAGGQESSAPSAPTDDTSEDTAATADAGAADTTAATLEVSGYGQDGDYIWVTSIVRNDSDQVGQFVTVSYNLLDEAGTLLATETQVESFHEVGQRLAVGTQVDAPAAGTVASVEATLSVEDLGGGADVQYPDLVLQPGPVTVGEDEFGGRTASGTLSNPSAETVDGARVGFVCLDAAGAVIGGGAAYPDLLPPSGEILVEATVLTSADPASCEMLASPGF